MCLPYLIPETIGELKAELSQTETELTATKSQFEEQQQQIEELKKSIEGLYHIRDKEPYPKTLQHTLINKKTGKMEEYLETVNNPQEEKEAVRKFSEKAKKLSES